MHRTRPLRLIAQQLAEYGEREVDFATDELWRAVQRNEPSLRPVTVFRMAEALVQLGALEVFGRYPACQSASTDASGKESDSSEAAGQTL